MAPRLLKAFKKGIPGGKLPPVPSAQNLQGLTDTARNLQTQANKGLQYTPGVRKAVPKSVTVFKTFGRTFKSQFSRLRRVVH